jgi:hypothetical protein
VVLELSFIYFYYPNNAHTNEILKLDTIYDLKTYFNNKIHNAIEKNRILHITIKFNYLLQRD